MSTNTETAADSMLDMNENEISKIIGLTVDIQMNNLNDIITGVVFTLIRANNMLVLLKKDEKDSSSINSYIINLKHLKSIKVSDNQIDIDVGELLNPNLDKIFQNEKKNLEKDSILQKSERDKGNEEMYQKGYAIYDKLSKFYKCSFENSRITLDELEAFLEEPFTTENLRCENESTRKRLIRMIESCSNSAK